MDRHQHITLAELQTAIRNLLADGFPETVWVSAEIADMKVNGSGHCYLELVEKDEQNDGIARAQARGVIWRSQYLRIAGRFEAESGQRLERGIAILVKVAVTYHELYGLSLQITDIDPSYTLGDIEMRKQQTIARLKADGVWDMNRETELPPVVQRVAVISSSTAAGFQDFCNELRRSGYAFRVELFEAVMQGASSEDSIIGSLERIAGAQEEFDVVVIIRGGGAVTDLNCFNSYRLASHIAQFPLPVITGIGHDKDVSVADMVAHTSLKTPTAVAVWLNDRMAEVEGALEYAAVQLHDLFTSVTREIELRLERSANQLHSLAERVAERQQERLKTARESLQSGVFDALRRQQARLESFAEIADSRSPKQILRLGFAIARVDGRAVKSVQQLTAGEVMTVELADGTVDATISNVAVKRGQRSLANYAEREQRKEPNGS